MYQYQCLKHDGRLVTLSVEGKALGNVLKVHENFGLKI